MLIALAALGAEAACPTTAVDLLVGHWRGRVSEEHWTPVGTGVVGVALQGGFFELLFASRAPEAAYAARPGGGPVTWFPCTTAGADEVRFEAPTHDWPRSVWYTRTPRGLRAVVGVGERGDLHLRWRSFAPEPFAVPTNYAVDPAAPLWWGETPLDAARMNAVTWEVVTSARASDGDLVAAAGTAVLDGNPAPFGAVWRRSGDAVLLVGFAAWP